jgi:hypothetical protein
LGAIAAWQADRALRKGTDAAGTLAMAGGPQELAARPGALPHTCGAAYRFDCATLQKIERNTDA